MHEINKWCLCSLDKPRENTNHFNSLDTANIKSHNIDILDIYDRKNHQAQFNSTGFYQRCNCFSKIHLLI